MTTSDDGRSDPQLASSLDDFSRVAVRHGTDKFGSHLYTPVYHELFKELRHRPLRILEIGIGGYTHPLAGGLGLSALAEYFPISQIVGLDIQEKRLQPHPRIAVVQGSQVDLTLLQDLWSRLGPFDIVIDDGSHLPDHVLTTFRCLYPLMRATGVYVVEDTQTSLWPHAGGRPDGVGSIFELAAQVSLAMHLDEAKVGGGTPAFTEFGPMTRAVRVYRNLVVFERGDNDYPSNHSFDPLHPEVARVRSVLAAENEINPSPGNYLTRIDMEVWSHRQAQALALAREAMERYPATREVLVYVYQIFAKAGLADDCREAADRLLKVMPSDPAAQQMRVDAQGLG